jgi:hypothetical protein
LHPQPLGLRPFSSKTGHLPSKSILLGPERPILA